MTTKEAKQIVLAAHQEAIALRYEQTGYLISTPKNGFLASGWLSERGAWNAAAEVVKPGCTEHSAQALYDWGVKAGQYPRKVT